MEVSVKFESFHCLRAKKAKKKVFSLHLRLTGNSDVGGAPHKQNKLKVSKSFFFYHV